MTLEEFLQFLDEFWELFGPIHESPPSGNKFKDIKL